MRFRHELSYDAAPAQVYAMLADPEFRRRACAAMEVLSADVQLDPDPDGGEGFTLVIDQLQNTQDLPAVARTFAGESTRAIQREGWLSRTTGSLSIEAPGQPITASGTIRLEPAGAGTTEVVELDIRVRVPLVGGKLEKLMGDRVVTGMEAEHSVGVAWLEGH